MENMLQNYSGKAPFLTYLIIKNNAYYQNLILRYHCPICNTTSILGRSSISYIDYIEQGKLIIIGIIECQEPQCLKHSIVKEEIQLTPNSSYSSVANIIRGFEYFQTGPCNNPFDDILSYNTSLLGIISKEPEIFIKHTEDEGIPSNILKLFEEVQLLVNVSPNASIAFSRKLLEKMILNKWPQVSSINDRKDQLPNLAKMIEYVEKNNLYNDTEIMLCIKNIGNYSIHVMSPEEDIEYQSSDATLAITVIDDLINDFYITPATKQKRKEKIQSLAKQSKTQSKEMVKETKEATKESTE